MEKLLQPNDFVGVSFWLLSAAMVGATVFFFVERDRNVAVAVTLVTLSVGAAAFVLFCDSAPSDTLLRIIFIGLSALTVPYMLLLEGVRRAPTCRTRAFLGHSITASARISTAGS